MKIVFCKLGIFWSLGIEHAFSLKNKTTAITNFENIHNSKIFQIQINKRNKISFSASINKIMHVS